MRNINLAGKKVLVTGADGFIGSHLIEALVLAGAKVKAFHLYNSWNALGWLSDINAKILNQIELFSGDIRDISRVKEAVNDNDIIYHLASLIGIPYSYVAYRSYYETNVIGTLNVLEACKYSTKVEKLVHTSTSEVYGTAQKVPIDEGHPLVGQSPYSASKIAADKLVESFNLSYELPTITVRPFNTFGPRQTSRAVIPTIISQLLLGKKKLYLGNIHASRDFNYVKDTVNAIINLSLCKNAIGKTINIGTGKYFSIQNTAKIIMNIIKVKADVVSDKNRLRPKKSEVNKLVADNTLLKQLINYKENYSFKNGLVETINWIKDNNKFFNKNEYKI